MSVPSMAPLSKFRAHWTQGLILLLALLGLLWAFFF